MGYKISIIIPLYNISWSIFKACLDSIFLQLDEETELIIINDGSKDRETVAHCREYIKKNNTVCFIDRADNKGVSATRNEGIENSHGRFLMFVDADDMLEPNALEKIRKIISTDDSIDTVFFEYSILNGSIKKPCFRKVEPEDCEHFTLKMAERMILGIDFNSPCTIAYSKELIQKSHIRFEPQIALGEDFRFNSQYLKVFEKGAYIKESLYLYRMRDGSATNSFSLKKVEDSGSGYFIGKNMLKEYFKKEDLKGVRGKFYNLYYKNLFSHILNGIIDGAQAEQIEECYQFEWVKDMLETDDVHINFPLKQIISCRSFNVFFTLSQIKKLQQKLKKIMSFLMKKVRINE